MDYVFAQRLIDTFVKVPGQNYPDVDFVRNDPWSAAEWLLHNEMVTSMTDYITSMNQFWQDWMNPDSSGILKSESEILATHMAGSVGYGGIPLQDIGLLNSHTESSIGMLMPCRDPCRCRSLAAMCSALLNKLQAHSMGLPDEAVPRFVWQLLGRFGSGTLESPL